MKKCFIFIFLLISCTSQKISMSSHSIDFYLEIKQIISGGNKQYTFIFIKNRLHIFEDSISRKGFMKREKVYSKKINNIQKIEDIEKKADKLNNLKSEYISAQLGGKRWEIVFLQGNSNKKIIVENNVINEIQLLFDIINSIIPDNKPQLATMP